MMRFISLVAVCLALASTLAPRPAFAASPAGLWLTENRRAVIRVAPCAGKWCGTVYWIVSGGMQTDSKNPDATQRGRPMCGLPVLWDFRQTDAAHWADGMIYKADDGDIYHATLQLLPTGNLLVHGYIGMPLFGVSQTWKPVAVRDYPACTS